MRDDQNPSWIEFAVLASQAQVQPLSDALLEAGALSVVVCDADAGTLREQAYYGEPGMDAPPEAWANNRLDILIEAHHSPVTWLAHAAQNAGLVAPTIVAQRAVSDQDWVRLTQQQFVPH